MMTSPMRRLGFAAASLLLAGAASAQQNILETAASTNRFNVLAAALSATGLDQAVSDPNADLTVFAPTDFAFYNTFGIAGVNNLLLPQNLPILEQVLLYHVVPGTNLAADVVAADTLTTLLDQRIDVSVTGSMVTLDEVMIQYVDITASNGVIHIIDGVLIPNLENIVETADTVGGFNTLLAALDATGLTSVVEGPGPFTVFAPTDDAFGALPAGIVDRLLLPVNLPILADILQYHVVSGRLYAEDVIAAGTLNTVNGLTLTVTVQGADVFINDSKVLLADVETVNGNIHVIDAVLLP